MNRSGISRSRAVLYLCALILLIGANVWRWSAPGQGPAIAPELSQSALPELPELVAAHDFTGFEAPPRRNLFQSVRNEAPPPPPAPEPVTPAQPDQTTLARRQAESILDKVGVIGFLSTGSGVAAVISYDDRVFNVFEGDSPISGFRVTNIKIDSVTLTSTRLDVSRTFKIGEAN